ncbi:MAG TPA: hypothetical protein VF459_09245 [Caulobacteraceae bacterium]
MTAHHTIDIGGTPADRTFTFGPPVSRMHKRGHIWFNNDPPGQMLQLKVITGNWVFENDGTDDGTLAFWISTDCDPATKTQFRDYGVFSPPTLDTATFTKLTFGTANNDEGVYYYMLRFRNLLTGECATCDPIIHNM